MLICILICVCQNFLEVKVDMIFISQDSNQPDGSTGLLLMEKRKISPVNTNNVNRAMLSVLQGLNAKRITLPATVPSDLEHQSEQHQRHCSRNKLGRLEFCILIKFQLNRFLITFTIYNSIQSIFFKFFKSILIHCRKGFECLKHFLTLTFLKQLFPQLPRGVCVTK